MNTPPVQHQPLPLRGPMSEQVLRELQARNDQKRQAAIAALGRDWILHPTNRVR